MADTQTQETKETQEDERQEEVEVETLHTHEEINRDLCGEITLLEPGYVEVSLVAAPEMAVDEKGLVHGGFIFGAADFAAMAAVNEENVVLAASHCQFLAPVKIDDVVLFKAKVRQRNGRKRNVEVEAFAYDIKIFTGTFQTVITEKHVLQLKLLETTEEKES
jgi:acyl-coenzyme A thioesterase PaaI-like protein